MFQYQNLDTLLQLPVVPGSTKGGSKQAADRDLGHSTQYVATTHYIFFGEETSVDQLQSCEMHHDKLDVRRPLMRRHANISLFHQLKHVTERA